jgi:hypothetical protein
MKLPASAYFGRATLLACVVAVASSAAWLETAAGEAHESTPLTKPHRPNRYDFMWRTPPLPHYIVAMSQDDALCDSIAKAFNDASTPEGAPPGSLYRAPMFVKWEHNPDNLLPGVGGPEADGPSIDVTSADPFNEGRKHPVVRVRLWGVRGPSYAICEFADARNLSRPGWKTIEDVLRDPKCTKIFDNDLYNIKVKEDAKGQRVSAPVLSPTDLNRIPRSKANRHDLRRPWALSPGSEINFIVSVPENSEFVVLRNPVTEVTLVTQFEGRTNPPENICLIGPEVPIDLHLQDRQRARKKAPQ